MWTQCGDRDWSFFFYKSLLKKRTGDLQWRILHGAIAINALISVIKPTVLSGCPFCGKVQTVFHSFYECQRLWKLFDVLEKFFIRFGEKWSKVALSFGAGYKKADACKWQLLILIVGEVKLSIYSSRKNKVEDRAGQEALPVFISLMKDRVWLDFRFHKEMNNIDELLKQWCYKYALCSEVGDDLIFVRIFR